MPNPFGIRPHPRREQIGNPHEIQVGWMVGAFMPWASCKDDAALAGLIADVKIKYGDIEIVDFRPKSALPGEE